MGNETVIPAGAQEVPPPQAPPPAPEAQPPDPKPAGDPSLVDLIKADPEKTASELKKLREENASHRKAAKEAKDALDAKQKADEEAESKRLTEQGDFKKLYETGQKTIETLTTELTSLRRKLVAAEFGLPAEIAARLQGETEDDLRKDAETLKAILPAQTQQNAGRSANTTTVPGGSPAKETDAQRRERLTGRSGAGIFTAPPGAVRINK